MMQNIGEMTLIIVVQRIVSSMIQQHLIAEVKISGVEITGISFSTIINNQKV